MATRSCNDHRALERAHAARIAEMDRQARIERWIRTVCAGRTYHSFDALAQAVIRHWEVMRGAVSEDERRILTNAARACFAGLSTVGAQVSVDAGGRPHAVHFAVLRAD